MIVPAKLRAGTALLAVVLSGLGAPRAAAAPAPAVREQSAATQRLLDYLKGHATTGFLLVRDGRTLIERNWPAPTDDRVFDNFVYERDPQGALLEDVASQQKSFVAVLVAAAIDRHLIDVAKPISSYIGTGWSKAAPEQEARITVLDILTMSSGLDETFTYRAPAGTVFFYNTPVYAITKRVLEAAAKQPLDQITADWLTGPADMTETAWRQRPGALASVGNLTGLVTSPRDIARFGQMILNGGVSEGGKRVVSKQSLAALFTPSPTNPAYGRLWWLNGSPYTIGGAGNRRDEPLILGAPKDLVAALGAFDRRLYVVPSLKLVVVRTGAAVHDPKFDQRFWSLLIAAID